MTSANSSKALEFKGMGPFTREGVSVGRGRNICEFGLDRKYVWLDGTPLTPLEVTQYKLGYLEVQTIEAHSHG